MVRYENGSTIEPFSRTCPQAFWMDRNCAYIFSELEDYRNGSLGSIDDMPYNLITYLRSADASAKHMDALISKQIRHD